MTVDLSREHFEKINVTYICFHFEMDGEQYYDDLGQSMPFDLFYKKMAGGAETKASQVNARLCDEGKTIDELYEWVEERFPKLDGKVEINYVGTTIGSHTGPGTVALFFWEVSAMT